MAQRLIDFLSCNFDIPCIAIFLLIVSQFSYLLYDLKMCKSYDNHIDNEIARLQEKIAELEEEKAYLIGVVELNGKLVD